MPVENWYFSEDKKRKQGFCIKCQVDILLNRLRKPYLNSLLGLFLRDKSFVLVKATRLVVFFNAKCFQNRLNSVLTSDVRRDGQVLESECYKSNPDRRIEPGDCEGTKGCNFCKACGR